MLRRIVIVGSGHAGVRFCEEMRDQGFAGELILIGEEACRPYERPPLSKTLLGGQSNPDDFALLTADQQAALAVEWRNASRADRIDRGARHLYLSDGTAIGYDRLVLATGVAPRRLDCPGSDLPGLYYLSDAHSALQLRNALARKCQSVVIVGGGFIGLEVAATTRKQGHAVTVVEGAARCLGRLFPASLSKTVTGLHVRHGVDIRTAASVAAIVGDHHAEGVLLASGEFLSADLVVIGIGSQPRVSLAEACGLEVDNGVVVDANGRSSDPFIHAIGDVAATRASRSSPAQRLESWDNAQVTARRAAASLMGVEPGEIGPAWFWTDQFGCNIQFVGAAAEGCDELTIKHGSGGCIHLYGRHGALEAVALVDAGRERRRMVEAVGKRQLIAEVAATLGHPIHRHICQEG